MGNFSVSSLLISIANVNHDSLKSSICDSGRAQSCDKSWINEIYVFIFNLVNSASDRGIIIKSDNHDTFVN